MKSKIIISNVSFKQVEDTYFRLLEFCSEAKFLEANINQAKLINDGAIVDAVTFEVEASQEEICSIVRCLKKQLSASIYVIIPQGAKADFVSTSACFEQKLAIPFEEISERLIKKAEVMSRNKNLNMLVVKNGDSSILYGFTPEEDPNSWMGAVSIVFAMMKMSNPFFEKAEIFIY